MNRKTSFLFLAVLLFQTAIAHADSLKDALNHKYKNQILALRSPFTKGDLKFDSAGQSLRSAKSSGWLLYGAIYVEKLSLSSNTLRLEGRRATYYDEKKSGKRMLLTYDKTRHIEIHLDQPLNSLDDADAIMERIFFLGPDAVDHIRPEFRRADDNTPDSEIYHVSEPAFTRTGANAPASSDNNVKVLPARAIYTPEPEFSEQARHAKYQGTVVLTLVIDKAGKISRIRVDRPLGMGLDENVMEGVEQWRFSPAMRNGEPVAVAMQIEVSFNLY
ncbi:MAG TPA: energy transducer TonB [Candidatus Angelobacter sp.]|nr:energy transducer TonB [Candidatus Angelobacter sp.]